MRVQRTIHLAPEPSTPWVLPCCGDDAHGVDVNDMTLSKSEATCWRNPVTRAVWEQRWREQDEANRRATQRRS